MSLSNVFLTPHRLVQIDIFGAFVTCAMTGALLATNVIPTGMPVFLLICMAFAAGGFFLIGLFCHLASINPSKTLQLLAILNASFCVVSGLLWVLHFERLTWFGRVYFPIEILIVSVLVVFEFRASR